jgi:phenylacetate-coenzyme A ligase PaaK-like adenylate-forming protein
MSRVFDPLRLSAVSLDIMAVNRGAPSEVAGRQSRRLAHVLDAALRGSRLYRELLPAGTTSATPLHALPVVTRGMLMARFDDWVTDPRLRLAELRDFTADPARIAEPWLGRYIVWESSGTSGQPGIFVQDSAVMAVYDALESLRRSTPRAGTRWLDPLYLGERMAFVGAIEGHFASVVSLRRLCELNPWMGGATRSFSIQQPAPELVAALNHWAPTVLATYPTAAALLADEAARGTLQIRPREIWTGGENLGAAVRAHIEHHLGATVRNSYGASEFLAMGWECAHGRLHLNADWVILEPVDEHHRPVPPGQPSCSVLLTNLANTVQPLIRYDLGDQITLQAAPCACGSPLPVIEVQGRQDDPLVLRSRDGRMVTLLPMALATVLEEEAGVFDFQLIQRNDHTLVLRLPLAGEAAAAAFARCRAALTGFATRQGLTGLRLVEEGGVPTSRGHSGKACRIVACQAGENHS